TEANPLRIRQCASEDCIYWFLDTSKSGRRRWCSMARCGNRAKVAKHYRQRSTPL
ncbi:MAG TPA: CGNR zinc finger domain-containing protein, partial [Gemmatimonadetes bacterium]|nr:CGNR zinc finger domain-containing protein [Gemmatimonadota bacterium]